MINLRYHIVSLTAVFLAIGIGLTLGSTFLDRATVENLNGQLERLEGRLDEREQQVQELERELEGLQERQTALDEQAGGLLGGTLEALPVVVISGRGADESDVEQTVSSLVVASADVQGVWWLTDRWSLEDEGAITDLAVALGEDTVDPARLRRIAIARLARELRARQLVDAPAGEGEGAPAPEGQPDDTGPTDTTSTTAPPEGPGDTAGDDAAAEPGVPGQVALVDELVEAGFIEFQAVSGGPDVPRFPDRTRTVFGAGSPDVPDDLVLTPMIERMAQGSDTPVLGVAGSVMPEDGTIADAVTVVREDEVLRSAVPSVDEFEHFEGWAAMILALEEVADGTVGHYGLAESASRLLPPLRTP